MLLEALAACAGVTLKAVATALEFLLGRAAVEAEGDIDFRGMLGLDRDAPAGFTAIPPDLRLDTDEPAERIDAIVRLTERCCVVFQTLARSPDLKVTRRLVDWLDEARAGFREKPARALSSQFAAKQ